MKTMHIQIIPSNDDEMPKEVKQSQLPNNHTFQSSITIPRDDELQYKIVSDNLTKKIIYISKNGDEKILEINYTALFNEDDFVETIMLVVDDVTEKEKLEKEISTKKKESEKNIQLITEMANADLEEIENFLRSAQMLVQNVLKMAKTAPTDAGVIGEMFRFLHTLKGMP